MTRRHRFVSVAVAAGAGLLAWVAQAQREPPGPEPFARPEFVEIPCTHGFLVPWSSEPGHPIADRVRGAHVECGYLSVLEDRAKPGGNVIRLALVRLRGSVPPRHPDPVIYLAGGPGESVLPWTGSWIDPTRFIWEERDLILLDQRGVGSSEPRLECPDYQGRKAELRELDLDPDEALRREVDALLDCKRILSEQGIDVSAYSPQAVAADVADLAGAMGYETYNLYGRGFGANVALAVMRDFPEGVRAVVLDGVWPPQVNASEARHANAASALQALFRRCAADPDCAERYPDLEQDLWQAFDRYRNLRITTRHTPPGLSEPFEERADGHVFLEKVTESLRSHSWIPYVPFLVHRIARGDDAVARRFVHAIVRFSPPMDNPAAWASLLCHAEGRFADRAAHPRMVDPDEPDLVPALCAAWHDPTVEPMDRTPVTSDIPTLLLSGEFDPDTPASWADLAAETLTGSHSIVAPMAGHGVGMDTPCGRRLTEAFLNAPSAAPPLACFPEGDPKRAGFRTIFLIPHSLFLPPQWGLFLAPVLIHLEFALRRNFISYVDTEDALDGRVPAIIFRRFLVALKLLPPLAVLLFPAVHVSALILWSVAWVIRRLGFGAEPAARQASHPRLTAAAIITVSLGFSLAAGGGPTSSTR